MTVVNGLHGGLRYFTWKPYQGQRRAILKTLIYHLFMVIVTITVAWFVTGSPTEALSIGIIANVAKTPTYYIYERTWDHITWGLETTTA